MLEIDNLSIGYRDAPDAVQGVSLTIEAGETVGIVGESGCGKSTLALSLIGLLQGASTSGSARLHGEELIGLPEKLWQQVRGRRIGMVFQDSLAALNPTSRVGRQLVEAIQIHQPGQNARSLALEMLDRVGIRDPERVYSAYPHQLSGGMRQRVVIAFALAGKPDLLIADEPTTALDVTIQAQILDLLRSLQQELGMSILLITHDLGVVAGMCRRVGVMHGGKLLEMASVEQLFQDPQHPYTQKLLSSIARPEPHAAAAADREVLVQMEGLTKVYAEPALDDLSLTIEKGEVLAIVGESGSGKSTLGRLLAGLEKPTRGTIEQAAELRTSVIFQDPYSSLNPMMSVEQIIAEPLAIHKLCGRSERRGRVQQLLELVGMGSQYLGRYPHELSGGQQQRVGIARALASEPKFLICDEPTSALDLSVQGQVIDLLRTLQREIGLTYLFISHDLSVVRALADRIGVLYRGQLVELGPAESVFQTPRHRYTRSLLASIPSGGAPSELEEPEPASDHWVAQEA